LTRLVRDTLQKQTNKRWVRDLTTVVQDYLTERTCEHVTRADYWQVNLPPPCGLPAQAYSRACLQHICTYGYCRERVVESMNTFAGDSRYRDARRLVGQHMCLGHARIVACLQPMLIWITTVFLFAACILSFIYVFMHLDQPHTAPLMLDATLGSVWVALIDVVIVYLMSSSVRSTVGRCNKRLCRPWHPERDATDGCLALHLSEDTDRWALLTCWGMLSFSLAVACATYGNDLWPDWRAHAIVLVCWACSLCLPLLLGLFALLRMWLAWMTGRQDDPCCWLCGCPRDPVVV
jgi:hypothetical protein